MKGLQGLAVSIRRTVPSPTPSSCPTAAQERPKLAHELSENPHMFDRVFLYSPIEKAPVIQVWPSGE